MKTIYQKPNTKVITLCSQYHLLAGSDIATGNAWKNGDVVLSRRGRMDRTWDDFVDEDDFE